MSSKDGGFEARFGHVFRDRDRYALALTHASSGGGNNYERLEFLGDRVLGLVIAELLYDHFPAESEGDLARRHAALVSGATLAGVAARLDLAEVLKLSDAERATGGARNDNILADVMEALIGALYMEAGVETCKKIIAHLWRDILHKMDKPPRDPKTALQEWAQGRGLKLPAYTVSDRDGPDHAPVFTITVTVEGFAPERGEGPSRRQAEKAAALALLARLEERG